MAFADTPREAKAMLAPVARHPLLRGALAKVVDRPSPLEALYQDNEAPFPQRRARADNIYTDKLAASARVLQQHMREAPSDGDTPVLLWRGTDPYPKDAAYSTRGRFYVAGYAQWDDAADDVANAGWLKGLYDELEPLATGHYINEFDRETRAARTPHCFAPADWQKLRTLRQKYDPGGVYHDFLGMGT